jgi:hypothetical protein
VVSVMDPYGRNLGFLDFLLFFQLAPQLCSVDPVPDPLLFRKSGSAGNRIRTSGSVARTTEAVHKNTHITHTTLKQSTAHKATQTIKDTLHTVNKKKDSVTLVHERTIPTERPPPVGEVSANFCGYNTKK